MDRTVFYGDVHPNTLKCPSCRSRRVVRFGHTQRVFKMLPVGRSKVELTVNIPRLCCKDCGSIRQPHLAFAEPKKHYTRSLERFVVDLCRVMSIQNVAELTGLGWDGSHSSLTGTNILSAPESWRHSTAKSEPCNATLMAIKTKNISN